MTDPQSAEAVRAGDARACGPGAETANARAVADLFGGLVAWRDSLPSPDLTVTSREWERALAEAKSGPAVDEAAFREELAERAQDIVSKINSGEIAHPDGTPLLPEGYRFEWK